MRADADPSVPGSICWAAGALTASPPARPRACLGHPPGSPARCLPCRAPSRQFPSIAPKRLSDEGGSPRPILPCATGNGPSACRLRAAARRQPSGPSPVPVLLFLIVVPGAPGWPGTKVPTAAQGREPGPGRNVLRAGEAPWAGRQVPGRVVSHVITVLRLTNATSIALRYHARRPSLPDDPELLNEFAGAPGGRPRKASQLPGAVSWGLLAGLTTVFTPCSPHQGVGTGSAGRWNGTSGGRRDMGQTARFQETLRRLAMIDEGFAGICGQPWIPGPRTAGDRPGGRARPGRLRRPRCGNRARV